MTDKQAWEYPSYECQECGHSERVIDTLQHKLEDTEKDLESTKRAFKRIMEAIFACPDDTTIKQIRGSFQEANKS